MILIPRYQDIHLPRKKVLCSMGGRYKMEAFKGRPIAGTGRPAQWVIHDPAGFPVEPFFNPHKGLEKLCSLNQRDESIPPHLRRYTPEPGYTLRELPAIPQEFAEKRGSRRIAADFFDNIITNQGLDYKGGTAGFLDHCHVGTGTATETESDTALGNFVRVHNSIQSSVNAAQGSEPHYGKRTIVYRFNPPGSNHNYAEIGISKQNTTGGIFSRARIKDGGGSPTTISVLADEWLDSTYELRNYPDWVSGDDTGNVDGYDYTLRAALVTQAANAGWADGIPSVHGFNPASATRTWVYSDNAALGAVTSQPTAASNEATNSLGSVGSYSNGTYNADLTYSWGLGNGNLGGNGIQAFQLRSVWGIYQMLTDNPEVAKDANKVLDVTFNFAWTRATI